MNLKKILLVLDFLFINIILLGKTNIAQAGCDWVLITTSPYVDMSKTICEGKPTVANNNCTGIRPTATGNSYYGCCCGDKYGTISKSNNASVSKTALFTPPDFQVKIPGLDKFETITCTTGKECSIPWIGQYISGIYNYALAIVGIIAAIVLMAGGLMWLISGGDASKITQAKELIIGSISGLVILIASYALLAIVNPDLVNLKPVRITPIEKIVIEGDNNSPNVQLDVAKISSTIGAKCGTDSVGQIINKAKGKVTYSQQLRNTSAPGGFIYLDCSSFAAFVLKCATGKNGGQRTADIFSDQQVWGQKIENLQPGDMIGWAPKNSKSNSGHVIIYMGNGLFGDCHGGSGKDPGNCVSNSMNLEKVKSYADSDSNGKLYFKRY